MNITELLSVLREDFLDDSEEPYLWSDTALVRNINEAQREACRRAYLIKDEDTATANDLYSGSATSTTANKLVDSGASFASAAVGMTVFNTTDNTFATVTALDSGTQLSLSADIMASGDNYIIGDASQAISRICVSSGTAKYALSSKVIKVDSLRLASDMIPTGHRTKAWMDTNYYQWKLATGKPVFHVEQVGSVILVPAPDGNLNGGTGLDTGLLEVYRLPLSDMSIAASSTTTEPEIAEEYHRDMLHYAARLAYMKQDAETYNPSRSDFHEAEFARKFGPPVSAMVAQGVVELPADFTLSKIRF